jgi:hypothetical protein
MRKNLDNRRENLQVMPVAGDHNGIHARQRRAAKGDTP